MADWVVNPVAEKLFDALLPVRPLPLFMFPMNPLAGCPLGGKSASLPAAPVKENCCKSWALAN